MSRCAGFATDDDLRCRFGSVAHTAHGTRIDGSTVLCLTPAKPPGSVPVELSLNAQDYTGDDVRFNYFIPPTITHVSPSSGPAIGATNVLLFGHALRNHTAGVQCRFGTTRVPATMMSDGNGTTSICVTPTAEAAHAESELAISFDEDARRAAPLGTEYILRGAAFISDDGALTITPND